MTSITPTQTYTDQQIITMLVASHGSIPLAAERLQVTPQLLMDRLPSLPYDTLTNAIKAARVLQAYDAYTVMQDVVFQTLGELTPDRRAKFLIEFMDRFEVMVNPPVHGGSGQSSQNNIQFNLGSPEAQSDARASLAERLINIQSRPSPDISPDERRRTIEAINESSPQPGDDPSLRLGVNGSSGAAGTNHTMDDLASPDR